MKKNSVFIIAEAGCNHNGSLEIARKLIKEAKICGADAVKFQTFHAENLIRRDVKKIAHLRNIKKDESVFDAMKKLEFAKRDYSRLKNLSQVEGIILFTSIFDIESLQLIKALDFPIIKIPSGEIVNLELLDAASRCGKPIILSTGMSNMEEIRRAVDLILRNLKLTKNDNEKLFSKYPIFKKGLILMHTVSAYPSPLNELNLRAIDTLKEAFGLPVGYSDHSIGDEACLMAATLGAELIEKHFTLDKNMDGPDHKASIEPPELKCLIGKLKNINDMLGDGKKEPSKSEKKMVSLFRKAIVAKKDIKKGESIKRSSIEIKRPLDGIGCEEINKILGLKVVKDIRCGDSIKWSDLLKNEYR